MATFVKLSNPISAESSLAEQLSLCFSVRQLFLILSRLTEVLVKSSEVSSLRHIIFILIWLTDPHLVA